MIWSVYYDHFGKENNQMRKELYKKQCANKMMEFILKKWIWDDTKGLWENRRFRQKMTEKIRHEVKFNRWSLEGRVRMLGYMGHFLLPGLNELPNEDDFQLLDLQQLTLVNGRLDRTNDAAVFLYSPTELRFWKNTKDRQRIGEETVILSAEEAHRLDAILCLR